MDTKGLERSIKTIIKTGEGYGPEFLPVLNNTKKILKRINKGRPSADHYFQLGSLILQLQDTQLALDAFTKGFQLNPSHTDCGTYIALIYEQKEKWDEALLIYNKLNNIDPNNIHIVERMLFILYMHNDVKSVLKR